MTQAASIPRTTLGSPRRPSTHQALITRALIKQHLVPRIDPRWIEAWIRVEHQSLDHFNIAEFEAEITKAIDCALASTALENERLARSLHL